MSGVANPVKSIEKIYNEELREVPYPLFMRCFDRLFLAPPKPDPAEPSPELKDDFRAVCMAAERGIADPEGRGKDRIKEFYEYVYPVWREKINEADFKEFQDILDGEALKQYRQDQTAKKAASEEGLLTSIEDIYECGGGEESAEDMHSRFEKAMQAALKAEEAKGDQQVKSDEQKEDTGVSQMQQGETPESSDDSEDDVVVLQSSNDLIQAVTSGKIELKYTDMQHKTPFASYYFQDKRVVVRLVKSEHAYYLYITYPVGFINRDDADQKILSVTSRLSYSEQKDFEYKLQGRHYALKLKFGPKATHLACRTEAALRPKTFVKALAELDKHLSKIVEVFQGQKADDIK